MNGSLARSKTPLFRPSSPPTDHEAEPEGNPAHRCGASPVQPAAKDVLLRPERPQISLVQHADDGDAAWEAERRAYKEAKRRYRAQKARRQSGESAGASTSPRGSTGQAGSSASLKRHRDSADQAAVSRASSDSAQVYDRQARVKAESPELEFVASSPQRIVYTATSSTEANRCASQANTATFNQGATTTTTQTNEEREAKRRRKEARREKKQLDQQEEQQRQQESAQLSQHEASTSRLPAASSSFSSTLAQASPALRANETAGKPWSGHPHRCPEGQPCVTPITKLPDELRRVAYHPSEDRYMNHHELLSETYIDSRKLVLFAYETGLRYSGGRFQAEEEAIMDGAAATFCQEQSMSRSALCELLQPAAPVPLALAYLRSVCRQLPGRPFYVVHRHLRVRFSDRRRQGPWTPAEDQQLLKLVQERGAKAVHTFQVGGRSGKDCSDRYHKHLRFPVTKSGRWTADEMDKLAAVVNKASYTRGASGSTGRVKWEWVSARIKDRTPKQCRDKWAYVCAFTEHNSLGQENSS